MPRTHILFLGGAAALVLFLVVGAYSFLGFIAPDEMPAGNTLPDIQSAPPPAATTEIRESEGFVDTRPVTYTNSGFSLTEVTIRMSDSIGCLITVVNSSQGPLRVGVNPHNPAGDPGANYGEIMPGKSKLIDARYPGLTEVMLHNHALPAQEFRVIYGEGCQ